MPIQSVVLAYRISDTLGTTVETMSFDTATSIDVEYVHEIEQRYLRPFVEITYWWTIVDMGGAKLTTEPRPFVYDDDRFEWQTQSRNAVTVHWYEGDLKIAQQAVDVAVAAIARAILDIPVDSISTPIDIYLYASRDDLHLALPAGLPSGRDALTLYETNVILVPYAPQASNIPYLRRILPHEVTHGLIHEVTKAKFDHVPAWLSEGLATSIEYKFAPNPDAQLLLEDAAKEEKLIALNTLCAEFPRNWNDARLAYAQSAAAVDHIRDLHGRQALRDLVAAYADGATCEGGVQSVLEISLSQLQASWRESRSPRGNWTAFWKNNGAWIVLLALFAGLPLMFFWPSRSSIRTSYAPAESHRVQPPNHIPGAVTDPPDHLSDRL